MQAAPDSFEKEFAGSASILALALLFLQSVQLVNFFRTATTLGDSMIVNVSIRIGRGQGVQTT
jgi:hypothetical protein